MRLSDINSSEALFSLLYLTTEATFYQDTHNYEACLTAAKTMLRFVLVWAWKDIIDVKTSKSKSV